MSGRPHFLELAARLGIEEGYVSGLDQRFVETSDATREALVAAMGFDGSSEAAAERALGSLPRAPAPGDGAATCLSANERLDGGRVYGLWANLYSVRSRRSLGFGDLGDLRELLRLARAHGGAFVGSNPLHVLGNRPADVSPYAPVSRLFRNPLYLHVEDVPELALGPGARARLEAEAGRIEALRASSLLDPQATESVLFRVLRPLHAFFTERASPGRREAYADYRAARDPVLAAFATFQALADAHESATGARDWRRWPEALHDPGAPAVARFARSHDREVDFHAWLQFELDRQLAAVAGEASAAGMPLGLYADLALGSAPGGFDTWYYREHYAEGVSVGAPPDAFSREGQEWGFPPLTPQALAGPARSLWRDVLDANLHGAGALRIDHALGLRRLFWIPEGAGARDGAYVRYPEEILLAEIAAASRRHGALVIGEDLGTVPPGFSEDLRARGLLGSRVLLFERDASGFRESGTWPGACLATANTHDLPPLAAWLGDHDLGLRRAVGQIPDDATLEALRGERRTDRAELRARLVEEECLTPDAGDDDVEAWATAIVRFLCRTPAVLVAFALDDLAGEREPINLPGVPPERHGSWVRRMTPWLEDLVGDPGVGRILAAVPSVRRSPGDAMPPDRRSPR